ncbi:MAG: FecR domain-containing protein, partial [Bacteroidota bacterium]
RGGTQLAPRVAGDVSPLPRRGAGGEGITRRRYLTIAAAITLLLTAGLYLLQPNTPTLEYATGNSERLEFDLTDGTHVTLNANSRLTLAGNDWNGGDRDVVLDGEAFFDVAKAQENGQARPFRVHTSGAVIHVLGTRFNVKNRRGADRVYLEEGSVSVNWTGTTLPETNLLPGEMVERHMADDHPVHLPARKPEGEIAWRAGHLLFDRLPLDEALAEVSDIYGIDLRCADDHLAKQELTSAGIPVDNLPLAIRLLETALDLKIEGVENSSTYWVTAAE